MWLLDVGKRYTLGPWWYRPKMVNSAKDCELLIGCCFFLWILPTAWHNYITVTVRWQWGGNPMRKLNSSKVEKHRADEADSCYQGENVRNLLQHNSNWQQLSTIQTLSAKSWKYKKTTLFHKNFTVKMVNCKGFPPFYTQAFKSLQWHSQLRWS